MAEKRLIRSHRDLEVWQEGMKLAETCYTLTENFPKREIYGLASQMRRAAVSIPSNIAEGHSRRSLAAYLNHLSIALGSQAELETQVELSSRLRLLPETRADEILDMLGKIGRMMHALIQSLQRSAECKENLAPST